MGNRLTLVMVCSGLMCLGVSGCASYKTPGARAELGSLTKTGPEMNIAGTSIDKTSQNINISGTGDDIQEIMNRQPAANVPAAMVFIRLQAGDYTSYTSDFGNIQIGNYKVMMVRDIEEDADFARIAKFPDMAQVGPINKMLLPRQITSDKDLRISAAKLRADMLFIYTVDTKYQNEDFATPLSVISLGLSPNVNVNVTSTVSGILYDVRTGFIYGVVDATEKQKQLTNWWQNAQAADQARLRVERAAFIKMIDEFEKLWTGVVADRRTALSAAAVKEVQ